MLRWVLQERAFNAIDIVGFGRMNVKLNVALYCSGEKTNVMFVGKYVL